MLFVIGFIQIEQTVWLIAVPEFFLVHATGAFKAMQDWLMYNIVSWLKWLIICSYALPPFVLTQKVEPKGQGSIKMPLAPLNKAAPKKLTISYGWFAVRGLIKGYITSLYIFAATLCSPCP